MVKSKMPPDPFRWFDAWPEVIPRANRKSPDGLRLQAATLGAKLVSSGRSHPRRQANHSAARGCRRGPSNPTMPRSPVVRLALRRRGARLEAQ